MFSLRRATVENCESNKLIPNENQNSSLNKINTRLSEHFKRCIPRSWASMLYLTEKPFPNCFLKSIIGFLGGFALTYLSFIFFVFQLSISLLHATFMSSIIGVLLTLGLAFSNRIRCLVLLIIPQFFSRMGRYSLTCYALVLILTGPATNTLRNSEVLTESMACSQEQIKSSVRQISDSVKNPYRVIKENTEAISAKLNQIRSDVVLVLAKIKKLVHIVGNTIQSTFLWLGEQSNICNKRLGKPYDHCIAALKSGVPSCKSLLGPEYSWLCNISLAQPGCAVVKGYEGICVMEDFAKSSFSATVRRKLKYLIEQVKNMLYVNIKFHNTFTISVNTSRSASQVAAGIVTEIRNRADPLFTWLSWTSYLTSFFVLLIIFRAKYYQHMYETRSRFDNRYFTKEFYELDLKRLQEGRDTILPLSRLERTKYIPMSSYKLIPTEKVFLTRSAVFMSIATFKLLIHMIADYSLFWVLITIRQHGRCQSAPGPFDAIEVLGAGYPAELLRSIISALTVPMYAPTASPFNCLPDPFPPDFKRYIQIGVLIILLWLFALFEPYGLRLRHVIMGHHRPERAKARASWLYNHILRTRGSFMKLARRRLHREYKYRGDDHLTFRHWLDSHIPCWCLRYLLGTLPKEPNCLLCETTENKQEMDIKLIRCVTLSCPGIYCRSCFIDFGELCTICMSPEDYGDHSDVSLERGSSDYSSDDNCDGSKSLENTNKEFIQLEIKDNKNKSQHTRLGKSNKYIKQSKGNNSEEAEPLLKSFNDSKISYLKLNAFEKKKEISKFAVNILHSEYPGENSRQSLNKTKNKENEFVKYISKLKYRDINIIKLKGVCRKNSQRKRRRKCFSLKTLTQLITCHIFANNHIFLGLKRKYLYGSLRKTKSKPQYKNFKNLFRISTIRIRRSTKLNHASSKVNYKSKIFYNKHKNMTRKFGSGQPKENLKKNRKQFKIDKDKSDHKRNISGVPLNNFNCHENMNKDKHSKKKDKKHNISNFEKTKHKKTTFSLLPCFTIPKSLSKESSIAYFRDSFNKRDKNFKRRKKKDDIYKGQEDLKNNESNRNYRLSTYLSDQSWAKDNFRNYFKDKGKQQDNILEPKSKLNSNLALSKIISCCYTDNHPLDMDFKDQLPMPIKSPTKCASKKKWCYFKNNKDKETDLESKFRNKLINNEVLLSEQKPKTILDPDTSRRIDFYRALGNEFDTKERCNVPSADCNTNSSMEQKSQNTNCTSSNEVNTERKQVEQMDVEKLTKFLKSFKILQSVKLAISDHILHIRMKNPIPVVKELYALLRTTAHTRENGAKKTNKADVDKAVAACPEVLSSPCQYNTDTVNENAKVGTTQVGNNTSKDLKPISPLRFKCDAVSDMETIPKKCTCATQYRNVSRKDKACSCLTLDTDDAKYNKGPRTRSPFNHYLPSSNESATSSVSSDQTNTTVCSHLTIIGETRRKPKRNIRKIKVNVITKSNQSTTTERAKLCDVSTVTDDWWSPIVERKPLRLNHDGVSKYWGRKDIGIATDRRIVKFLSRAQIIPSESYLENILSPSRYLLESQKYYNELFSSKLFVPHAFPSVITKTNNVDKPTVARRKNCRTGRKTKRLDESPRLKKSRTHVQRTHSDETNRSYKRRKQTYQD